MFYHIIAGTGHEYKPGRFGCTVHLCHELYWKSASCSSRCTTNNASVDCNCDIACTTMKIVWMPLSGHCCILAKLSTSVSNISATLSRWNTSSSLVIGRRRFICEICPLASKNIVSALLGLAKIKSFDWSLSLTMIQIDWSCLHVYIITYPWHQVRDPMTWPNYSSR